MKPNILFGAATFNLAETTRMIEIVKACAADFEPHFCGYGGKFVSLITEAGYPFHLLQPELTEEKIEYLWRVDRMEAYGQPFTVAELTQRVESELALYRTLQPRAVVMGSLLSASISARVARIPLVNVVPFPLTRAYLQAGLPALPNVTERPGVPPLLGQAANRLINGFLLYVPVLTKNFNVVARQYGLAPFPSFFGVWEGDYNLVADVPLLTGVEPQALPPFWQYVGPIFAHLDEPVPPAVAALAAQRARPLIYFAMGSSGNREVVKQVLASFAGMDVDVVAPIKALLADEAVTAPPNVLVTDYLPALEVNRMADLAVIHGGQGTVQTACMAGRPFVGVGMQPEQEINIEFVVRWGSAVRVERNKVTPERMRAAVRALLDDQQARERAEALAAEIARWDGPERVAAFLKEQFGAPEPPAGYEPMQNLAGQKIEWRRWLVGAAGLGLALLLWRGRRRGDA